MKKCCCDLLPEEMQHSCSQLEQLDLAPMLAAAQQQEVQLRMQVLTLSRALQTRETCQLTTAAAATGQDGNNSTKAASFTSGHATPELPQQE
jgi:hypothetical protein